jgi:hypothetical protein
MENCNNCGNQVFGKGVLIRDYGIAYFCCKACEYQWNSEQREHEVMHANAIRMADQQILEDKIRKMQPWVLRASLIHVFTFFISSAVILTVPKYKDFLPVSGWLIFGGVYIFVGLFIFFIIKSELNSLSYYNDFPLGSSMLKTSKSKWLIIPLGLYLASKMNHDIETYVVIFTLIAPFIAYIRGLSFISVIGATTSLILLNFLHMQYK